MITTELDIRPRQFVDLLLAGNSNADAYRKAGYKATNTASASASANRLLKTAKVATYMAKRQAEIRKANMANLEERLELCSNILRDPEFIVHPLAMKAIELMNKMEGVGNPEADALGSLADALAGLGGHAEDRM